MPTGLQRRYGQRHLHFITCSCYRRLPLLRSVRARNLFIQFLGELRAHYQFALVGLVVMPEHFHLLIGEPTVGTLSTVLQVLKQRVSRKLRQRRRKRLRTSQLHLWHESPTAGLRSFWQRRRYHRGGPPRNRRSSAGTAGEDREFVGVRRSLSSQIRIKLRAGKPYSN